MEEYSNDKVLCIVGQLQQELNQDKYTYKIPSGIDSLLNSDIYALFIAESNIINGQNYIAKIENNKKIIIQNKDIHIDEKDFSDNKEVHKKISECYKSVITKQSTQKVIYYKVKEEIVRYVNSVDSGKYYIGWIAVCDKDASFVEQYSKLVILKLLTEIIDKMDYFAKDSEMISGRIKEIRFNFMEWYTDIVFEKMGFNTIIDKLEITKREFINLLGYKEYERRQCCSSILFCNEDQLKISNKNAIYYNISIQNNINLKAVLNRFRKALEVCSNRKLYLVIEESKFEIKGIIKDKINDVWAITFIRKGEWSIKYDDQDILHYLNGTYYIPNKERNQTTVAQKIHDELSDTNAEMVLQDEVIEKLDRAFGIQEHGALMIICDDAKNLSENLCNKYNRGVQIMDLDIKEQGNETYLEGMLSVDGAVLMTTDGICHGFGVILDGEAKVIGRDDRGARYNSAVNYVKDKNMLAIVQSEDKENGVDVIFGKHI